MPLCLNHHIMKKNGRGIAPRILGRATAQAFIRRPLMRRHGFNSRPFHIGFVKGKGTLGKVFLGVRSLLGAFVKLRKTTVSYVLSVCLSVSLSAFLPVSVCMSVWLSTRNNSAPPGRIFMKSDIWIFFEKVSRKFKFDQNLTGIT